MKIKNKNIFYIIFIFVPLLAGFFAVEKCWAKKDENIVISEILINGTNGEEFIELYNPTSDDIELEDYYFTYYSSKKEWDDPYKDNKFPNNSVIKSRKFFLIEAKGGLVESVSVNSDWSVSYNLSNSNGSIAIFPDDSFSKENYIDMVAWGEVERVGKGKELKTPKSGISLERIDNSSDKWQESFIANGTPGEKNSEKPESKDYSGKVKINEIYPSPITKEGEEEFVEIISSSEEKIDISDLCLKEENEYSKKEKGKCKKISEIKQNGKFYVLYGSFSLNNSGDTVFLFDKNGALIDSQNYASAKSGHSYSFDGSAWRWTSKPTPGEENKFDKILSGKIKIPDKIYKNVYAEFEVKADKDAQKFTWNFGDGHKSYLQKTKHKYKKTGKYEVSLKIRGNGEDKIYNFTVEVEKYEAPKIKIIKFSPNPKGNDTTNEWIEIQNKSKKKINLKNWSIATGWDNLYNHPIREDFEIKAGKTKKLTRKICAFTLNNKKTKIELRDPSGKAIQKIKYDRKKDKLEEDEIYEKFENGWEWNAENVESAEKAEMPNLGVPVEEITESNNQETDFNITDQEIRDNLGKYTENPDYQNKIKNNSKQPIVLGAENVGVVFKPVPTDGNSYIFTAPNIPEKHWAVKLTEDIWEEINSLINKFTFKF